MMLRKINARRSPNILNTTPVAAPQRVVALANAHSGFGWGRRVLRQLNERSWPADVTTFETKPGSLAGHQAAIAYARESGADRLIVAGGDGTLMETLTSMMDGGPVIPIYVIPAGTGNIVANDLAMPRQVMPAVKCAFLPGLLRWWDVGRLENTGQVFALRVSAGHDASTLAAMPEGRKRFLGSMAYALPAWREYLRAKPATYTLTIDDASPFEVTGITAFVAATSRISGRLDIVLSHGILPDDGLLHVGIFRPHKLLRNLPRILNQASLEVRDIVSIYPVRERVKIESNPLQLTQVDGELLAIQTPLEVTNLPNTAPFVTPIPTFWRRFSK